MVTMNATVVLTFTDPATYAAAKAFVDARVATLESGSVTYDDNALTATVSAARSVEDTLLSTL